MDDNRSAGGASLSICRRRTEPSAQTAAPASAETGTPARNASAATAIQPSLVLVERALALGWPPLGLAQGEMALEILRVRNLSAFSVAAEISSGVPTITTFNGSRRTA